MQRKCPMSLALARRGGNGLKLPCNSQVQIETSTRDNDGFKQFQQQIKKQVLFAAGCVGLVRQILRALQWTVGPTRVQCLGNLLCKVCPTNPIAVAANGIGTCKLIQRARPTLIKGLHTKQHCWHCSAHCCPATSCCQRGWSCHA